MKARDSLHDKLTEQGGMLERGYDAWKRAKIQHGLTQAQDRSSLIPVEQILRDFGLEG